MDNHKSWLEWNTIFQKCSLCDDNVYRQEITIAGKNNCSKLQVRVLLEKQTVTHHKKFQKQIQRTQEIQNHPSTLLSRLARGTKPVTPAMRAVRSQKQSCSLLRTKPNAYGTFSPINLGQNMIFPPRQNDPDINSKEWCEDIGRYVKRNTVR
jgi:hypothetical protein